jgi:hypothetical protein
LCVSTSYHASIPKTCNVTFGDSNWEFLFGCVVVKNGENINETLINFLLQSMFHSFHYLMCMVELQDVLKIFGYKRQTFWNQQSHYSPIICKCNFIIYSICTSLCNLIFENKSPNPVHYPKAQKPTLIWKIIDNYQIGYLITNLYA